MLPNMNPKQIASMMKQMGIKNEEIPAQRVIVEKADGSKLIVEPAQVIMVEMQGQKSLQVSGSFKEAADEEAEETDAGLVMNETGCSKEEAEAALKETGGDLAEAILKLKGD